jgi:hypothetical protein
VYVARNDSARAAVATVRFYREHMADQASMRALEVWYHRFDVERFMKETGSEETRECIEQRVEKGAQSNRTEHETVGAPWLKRRRHKGNLSGVNLAHRLLVFCPLYS